MHCQKLCHRCYAQGYCQRLAVRLTSDEELSNSEFVCDVKMFIPTLRMGPVALREYLSDQYRDMHGMVYDLTAENVETPLDLNALEDENGLEWLKTLCFSPPIRGTSCRVRCEKREAFKAISTILRYAFPHQAKDWGRPAANDNLPRAANDNEDLLR